MANWKWWRPDHLLIALRVSALLVGAEDALARDKTAKAWDRVQRIERLLGETWPIQTVPPNWNLEVARIALANGRYQVAHECALEAERQLRNPPDRAKLRPADRTYLIYYAVMLSRWARRDDGEVLPDKSLYYPPMSEPEVDTVDLRWRRMFPLVKGGTAP